MKANLQHHLQRPVWGTVLRLAGYLVPGLFLLTAGLLLFSSAGRDDAHITYWSSYTLAHFGEMLNYNGVRVEQSSSLLHVIFLALFAKVTGIEMVTLGKISSIVFGMISVALTAGLVTRVTADRAFGFSAALMTAAYPYFIYWSYGGLETTLASLTGIFLIMAVAGYVNDRTTPRLILALLAMLLFELVRPETLILLGCILAGAIAIVFLKERINRETPSGGLSPLLKLFGAYVLFSASIFLFRLWYFGDMFPQPVSAKAGGIDLANIAEGALYLKGNLFGGGLSIAFLSVVMAACFFVVLAMQFRKKDFNFYLLLSLLYVTGYIAFVLLVSGDWMEGGRFLVPFIPLLISMILIVLAGMTRNKLYLALITLLLVGVEVKAALDFTYRFSTGVPLWSQIKVSRNYDAPKYSWFERHNRVNMRDVYIMDYLDYLITEISPVHKPVTIMSAQMGMVPYHISLKHFGDVEFIDRAGLADRTFTDCKATQNLSKGGWVGVSYEYYFENFLKLEEACQISRPDIVFDISVSDLTTEMLEANGYTVVYMQTGDVVSNEKWLEGFIVKGRHILGVRSDLLESLEIEPAFVRLKD
jgi:hypothetical protein